ncbi:MAG: hypothetical protein IJC57_00240 [Clostridia bacterium]|nr:hypothetical protein [Clostridia bacterium]
MKKLNKILAITSTIMLMSCVGGSPRAVKYNEKGVPYALELPKNPTETQVFNELQIVEDFIYSKSKSYGHEKLMVNTLKSISRFVFLKKGCSPCLAEWISNQYYFKDLNTVNDYMLKNPFKRSEIDSHYYQEVLEGNVGICCVIAGYFYNLLRNSNIDCKIVSLTTSPTNLSHSFVAYKPIRNSTVWYVLPCGLVVIEHSESKYPVSLRNLNLTEYITTIKDSFWPDAREIIAKLQPELTNGICYRIRMKETLKRLGVNLFEDTNLLMEHLIANHNKHFNLK